MPTSEKRKEQIVSKIDTIGEVNCRKMMGEYLLYLNGVHFGGIYDDRLLVKPTEACKQYQLPQQLPYAGAKAMYFVDDKDWELAKTVISATVAELAERKK